MEKLPRRNSRNTQQQLAKHTKGNPSQTQQQTLSTFKETVEEVKNKNLKQDKISVKSINRKNSNNPSQAQPAGKQSSARPKHGDASGRVSIVSAYNAPKPHASAQGKK